MFHNHTEKLKEKVPLPSCFLNNEAKFAQASARFEHYLYISNTQSTYAYNMLPLSLL